MRLKIKKLKEGDIVTVRGRVATLTYAHDSVFHVVFGDGKTFGDGQWVQYDEMEGTPNAVLEVSTPIAPCASSRPYNTLAYKVLKAIGRWFGGGK